MRLMKIKDSYKGFVQELLKYEGICEYCNKRFRATVCHKKYCCSLHRFKAYRDQKRNKKKSIV